MADHAWIHLAGRRALVVGVAIAVFGGLLIGGAFILSGVYNVAASVEHFRITNALIRLTLRRSVATHSLGIQPPEELSDEALARLGARHFALGCLPCHASPAGRQNPVAREMYPSPPPLSGAVTKWQTEELFWIVKHGLKFTGMPAWPAPRRDEEVWALVAFLQHLPDMNATTYTDMAGAVSPGPSALSFETEGAKERTLAVCASCHGSTEEAPVHPFAPPLGGQKPEYLYRALTEYAANRRQSGIMEVVASALAPRAMEELARFYARAGTAPPPSREAPDAQAIRRGAEIALNGVRSDDIPACRSCHSSGTSGEFPLLDGLPAEFIGTQLRLFSKGIRNGSTYAAIMAPIARRLNEQQIEDVAAYLASRRRPSGAGDTAASETPR